MKIEINISMAKSNGNIKRRRNMKSENKKYQLEAIKREEMSRKSKEISIEMAMAYQ